VSPSGSDGAGRRPRLTSLWSKHRARWTLPLVIIFVIGLVAVVDHLGSHRIRQVDALSTSPLVDATGGAVTVELDHPWSGFNPNTPAGAGSSTPTLMSSVLPSAYVISPKLISEVNTNLLVSVEATSTTPLIIQYVINPRAVWSDGVPVSADDFIYAWQSQRGDGVDVTGRPDQVASTLGYRDVASVTPSGGGKTVTVKFSTPYTDWRDMFDHMVPAHIAKQVGWNHGFDNFSPAIDLSAGPMMVQSVSPTGTAVLVPNPRWWGTPAVVDKVTVNVAPSASTWSGTLVRGSHAAVQPLDVDLRSLDAVSSLPDTQSVVKPSLRLLDLEFNVASPVMSRVAARQAVAHAINRTELLNRMFGAIEPDLVVNQDHLATASQTTYNPSSAAGEYSSRDAPTTDRLLRSIGYHQNLSGQYVDAYGVPLTLRMAVLTGDPWIMSLASEISSQLRQVGIGVQTIPVGTKAALATAAASDGYDMALVTRLSSPFATVTAAWYSDGPRSIGPNGTEDWSNFDDPQVDQLFSQAAQALNPVTGGAIYGQIDDQLWDQMVALPLFAEPGFEANGVQLANAQYNPSADGILWNVSLWTTLKPGPSDRQTS
jgi:peptide/nickel transport system substrate-binding protein